MRTDLQNIEDVVDGFEGSEHDMRSRPSVPAAGSGFAQCADCTDDMCSEIKECMDQIYLEAWKEEEEYITKGVCSDCGACSLKDAEGKCRPRALGDTGDVTCAGEKLWRDQDEEQPEHRSLH